MITNVSRDELIDKIDKISQLSVKPIFHIDVDGMDILVSKTSILNAVKSTSENHTFQYFHVQTHYINDFFLAL